MWHRPSKIPPGSITMPRRMNLTRNDAFSFDLNAAPSRRLRIEPPGNHHPVALDLSFTFAPSPRITVCSEMMFPFTLPSMRNVPVTVNVPSSHALIVKPVHSSV